MRSKTVGTTDPHWALRGEEGSIFFQIKCEFFFAFRYAANLKSKKWRANHAI